MKYYDINEDAARTAKHMNSFYDYVEGSATAEYRGEVDKAIAIAEAQKAKVDVKHHEKIDALLDRYARKLADNYNKGFAIESRCPSVMVSGPANFPVRKKEKQNAARDRNMDEWKYIKGLLGKIQSVGLGAEPLSLDKRGFDEAPQGWEFDGGKVEMNVDDDRLQIFYDSKPDEATRQKLKSHGFKWAPSQGAWQRILTKNAVYAAKQVTDGVR